MEPWPLIAVKDVPATSRWYQQVLGLSSGHGGEEYEQLFCDGRLVLQLHRWNAHDHPHLGSPAVGPSGNGVVLWFYERQVVEAFDRAVAGGAEVLESLQVNPQANHREFWLRDPNGYIVVVAGSCDDAG